MRLYSITKSTTSARVFVIGVMLTASVASFAIIAGVSNQLRYERARALQQLGIENQARVRTFEQYVLRTLDLAVVTAHHAEMLLESGDLKAIDRVSHNGLSPFTAIFVLRGPNVFSSRNDFRLSDRERNTLVKMATTSQYDLYVSPPEKFAAFPKKQIAVVARSKPAEPVVVLLIEPKQFTQFANDIPFAPDDLISLIGLDGVTRARRTGSLLSGGEPVRGLVMNRQMKRPNGSYLGPSVLDGKVRYFSHRRIADYGMFVTSGRPLELVAQRIAHRRISLWLAMIFAVTAVITAASTAIILRLRRQRRLDELMVANRRLGEAQQIGQIADWDYDAKNDRLYLSENLLKMYGRPPQEGAMKLDAIRNIIRDRDLSIIEKGLNQVLKEGKPAAWELDVVLADGQESTRRITAVPVRNWDGDIIAAHGTDQDITSEAKVRDLELKIAEAARLDSMSALAATLAHELNQPLGVAMNYLAAARVKAEAVGDRKLEKYLEDADSQLEHLAQIVTGARELVLHSGSSFEDVDLEYATSSTVILLKAATKRRVSYTISVESELPRVMANGAQIKQVLFNLGKNGIEAVPAGRKPQIAFRIAREGKFVRFEVEDNGDGSWNLENDPFAAMSTTKEHGLGLGLSLARTIIEGHGGKIWIEKTGVNGTTVAFLLEITGH